jgi:hypothetical protein
MRDADPNGNEEQDFISSDPIARIKNYTRHQNIISFLSLDPYERTLYAEYVRMAGIEGGCWMSNKKLASLCGMSESQLKLSKKQLSLPRLGDKSLIKVKKRVTDAGGMTSDLISIVDIWDENNSFFSKKIVLENEVVEFQEGKKTHSYNKKNITLAAVRLPPSRSAATPQPQCGYNKDSSTNIPLEKEERKNKEPDVPKEESCEPLFSALFFEEIERKEKLQKQDAAKDETSYRPLSLFFQEEVKKHHQLSLEPSLVWWDSLFKEICTAKEVEVTNVRNLVAWSFSKEFWRGKIKEPADFIKFFDTLSRQYKEIFEKKGNTSCGDEKEYELRMWANIIQQSSYPFSDKKEGRLEIQDKGIMARKAGKYKFYSFTEPDFKGIIVKLLNKWNIQIKGINDGLMAT